MHIRGQIYACVSGLKVHIEGPSQALPITTLILESFHQDAEEAWRFPPIVVFPMPFDSAGIGTEESGITSP